MNDSKNSHYKKLSIEPIDVINDLCRSDEFYLGNILKYVLRCNYKGDKKGDLEKARYYLELAIAKLTEESPASTQCPTVMEEQKEELE